MATKQVNIDIIAKDKTRQAMNSATRGVNKLTTNVQKSVQTQQRSFLALGTTIKSVLGAVALIQTARFSANMVQMASAVEEMQSKSSVVFGQFVSSVRKDLEKFGDNVGRSTFELEKMASSIQDTFVPMGFARGEASKLSIQLTKLAVDVASFNNASDVDTMMAFQSALVGNHETVRRFGVVITEATLKQELLRMGITKTAKEVTNAEKVQARLNLIIAGTSDAHGDAERTNDSFANSMKALSAEFNEFMVEALTPLLPTLSKMVQSLKDSIIETKEFLRSVGLLSKLDEVVPIVDHLAKNSDKLSDAEARLAHETALLEAVQKKTFGDKFKDFISANSKFSFSILKGERAIEARKEELKKEIEQIKLAKEMIVLESESRILTTNAIKNQTEATKALNKEKEKQKSIEDGLIISDASMGGVPVNAHLNAFTNEERLEGVKNIANQEFEIMKKVNDDKIKAIMENDELQLELARIHSEEKLKIAKETADKEAEIEKKLMKDNFEAMKTGQFQNLKLTNLSKEQEKDIMIQGGKQILSGIAENNKQGFALNKAYNMANAIMNTAQGVSKALATGNIPMAILIGALGAVQIATISQTKYQGRKLGGRMNQGQPYMVGEAGAELIVPDRPSNVVPNNKLGSMSQPVNVNFNISTVDARGFNELLVNSRGTIVNLINTAVNEKGKMAII